MANRKTCMRLVWLVRQTRPRRGKVENKLILNLAAEANMPLWVGGIVWFQYSVARVQMNRLIRLLSKMYTWSVFNSVLYKIIFFKQLAQCSFYMHYGTEQNTRWTSKNHSDVTKRVISRQANQIVHTSRHVTLLHLSILYIVRSTFEVLLFLINGIVAVQVTLMGKELECSFLQQQASRSVQVFGFSSCFALNGQGPSDYIQVLLKWCVNITGCRHSVTARISARGYTCFLSLRLSMGKVTEL